MFFKLVRMIFQKPVDQLSQAYAHIFSICVAIAPTRIKLKSFFFKFYSPLMKERNGKN